MAQLLHDDADAVDGDAAASLQHGLPVEPEAEAEAEPTDPLGFR